MKWISTRGTLVIASDKIVFESPKKTKEKSYERAPQASAKSNIVFADGSIEATVLLSVPEDRVTWVFKGPQGSLLLVGLNTYGNTYSIIRRDDDQWKVLSASGVHSTPSKDQPIHLKITSTGSQIVFLVEGVRVAEATFEIMPDQPEIQISGYGKVQIEGLKFTTRRRKAFVVMQFTEEFNSLFREVIKPTCEKFDLEVVRADDFFNNGLIIEDINRSLRESAVIIADITPNNPNVYYEVGYAHALGKPTILLSDKKREKLPFDVSGFRTLFYDNSIGGKSAVEEVLAKHLKAIFPEESK
jgi:hypothetical protein